MNITETREKCKSLAARVPRDVLTICILVLASSFSFGFGCLAGLDAGRGSEVSSEVLPLADSPIRPASLGQAGQVVASKSGTKYYLPECAGVERIAEANKVWFTSPAAAIAVGYAPAANCEGI